MARNILLLMADELRFDLPGFMGNPIARTPTLDRLAREAVVFDNAYTPSPVCVPARQCIATGKYPLHADCERFGEDIAPGSMTFARAFSEAGYLTVACGKLHHRGPDQMQGWLQRIGAECAVQWPNTYGAEGREQIGRLKWRGAEELELAGPGTSPLALHDRLTVDGAADFLRMHFEGMYRRTADVPPLLLMVSLQQPHFPLLADPELLAYYHDRVRPRLREEAPRHPALGRGALPCGEAVTPQQVRTATAAYYALVETADRELGRVIDAIEARGQDLDDWLVVFLSDHGEMLGEHALWEKRKFYEGSVRVPMFVRAPRRWPAARRRENVSTLDLFPTLCAAAGIEAPADLDARSLAPLLEGRTGDWLNETYAQYDTDEFMLKRGNLKYLTFGGKGPDVLFDLAGDPGESSNQLAVHSLAASAEEMRERLHAFIETRTQRRFVDDAARAFG
ncbi:MAG: sulfatase-like hydrolase/transferase [Terrimicrobiaceae bacterium]|nr:sulfatase-like hydrolase/transferase [Terrimicrobiaceae bacterium]